MNPKITVLMSVYNGERYLRESIDSILGQTFQGFEFLIIDDGSTDQSVSIIQSYHDSRIRIIHNKLNLGLTKSLNIGLKLAKGKYIARMDADDISLPERLVTQVDFMDRMKSVGICGTWLEIIGEKKELWEPPCEDKAIRASMVFENVLYHPTVMLRHKFLKENNLYYDESLSCAQDYELWSRCSRYMKLANIDEILLRRRVHSEAVGSIHHTVQRAAAEQVRLLYINNIGLTATEQEFDLHNAISSWEFTSSREFVLSAEAWLTKLKSANEKTLYMPESTFSRILAARWYRICRNAQKLGFWTWKTYKESVLRGSFTPRLLNKLGFGARCLLRI